MHFRTGYSQDFDHIAPWIEVAILSAFDHPTLDAEQRAENRRIVAIARPSYEAALRDATCEVFVAALADGRIGGYVIAARTEGELPEIDWLMVAPEFQGQGVAQGLMDAALERLGAATEIKLGVIHYNARAIRFYEKYGFRDTGCIAGSHKIPRRLMLRPAQR